VRGWGGGQYFGRRQWIGLLQYNPSKGERVTRALRKGKKETEGKGERVRKKKGNRGRMKRWKTDEGK
jgi:hypothetical protein